MSRWDNTNVDISSLIGKTLVRVQQFGDDRIEFEESDGTVYQMLHYDDCCEHVSIESITGDLTDLEGSPITLAEENNNGPETGDESYTWTFYKLATNKGYVDIRWYGSSNGYYSESVDFEIVKKEE